MSALSFLDARATVIREVRAARSAPAIETVRLEDSLGRILAEDAPADRDYPPFHRATRDGFAVRSADLPGRLVVVDEVRAGDEVKSFLTAGEAIEIMTGAPVPDHADAVIMVEHVLRIDAQTISTDRTPQPGENIARSGTEARRGTAVLARGARIDYSSIAWLATTGRHQVQVYAKPRVAILATGDELVAIDQTPAFHQIRNSNAYSLASQVARAGGEPVILPIARDNLEHTIALIRQGLDADLLLLSGGVSAGKYDLVESALESFQAEFYFDRVLIQPGQPVVFGKAGGKFFFGLPGNPVSTMVTFEIFARAALELLSGAEETSFALTLARLARPLSHKPGLTRFLPADISCTEVTPVDWHGSGDVPAICRANAFLVADAEKPDYAAGDLIPVLLK